MLKKIPKHKSVLSACPVRRGGFLSRKGAEPCPPRWAQRNCGPHLSAIGLISCFLALGSWYLPARRGGYLVLRTILLLTTSQMSNAERRSKNVEWGKLTSKVSRLSSLVSRLLYLASKASCY